MSSPGSSHRLRQRLGVGAVAVGAVLRDVAGLRRKGNQRALRRLHLREPAGGRAQAASAERIVAAGVEDDEIELGAGALHLAQHQIGVEHLEVDVGLLGRIGVDRHEIIRAAHLHAVAGIVEQPDIGALQLRAESLHGAVEAGLVEIELRAAADQREAERAQRVGHQLGVVRGIVEPRDVAVGRVADDQRDALVGECRDDGYEKQQAGQQGNSGCENSGHTTIPKG